MNKEDRERVGRELRHLAIIMDGNGRWATRRGKPRSFGHRAGVKRIRPILDECFFTYGIKTVSLFVFSAENWSRDKKEISYLFNLLKRFFEEYLDEFKSRGIRIAISGDLSDPRIPPEVKTSIVRAVAETAKNTAHTFNVLFNYGGRQALLRATKAIGQAARDGIINLDQLDLSALAARLDNPELGEVDLLIRTSGEQRLSNCLLFEAAYAELVFTPVLWPDYSSVDLEKDITEFLGRHRRYGGIKKDE